MKSIAAKAMIALVMARPADEKAIEGGVMDAASDDAPRRESVPAELDEVAAATCGAAVAGDDDVAVPEVAAGDVGTTTAADPSAWR